MQSRLISAASVFGLVLVALLVWAGQGHRPDMYLERVTESGVLRVGVDPSYPPFAVAVEGRIEGYEAELARTLADDMGVRAEFVPLALDTLYDALEAGRVDVLISSLPFVHERQDKVRYSRPYYQAGQVIVVRRGSPRIGSTAGLRGRRVGVELGSAADTEARRLARTEVPRMEVISTFEMPEDALEALLARSVDVVITDSTSAYAFLNKRPGTISIMLPPVTDEPYVIAMPVRAGRLAAQVNATLSRLAASGELDAIMGLDK